MWHSELTVLRMKSGLKCTLSPQRFISDGVGSFLDTKAVMDSLLPPLTTATKSSAARPRTVSSVERQVFTMSSCVWSHTGSDKTRSLTSHLIQQAVTASSFNPTWHINAFYVGPEPKAHLCTTVVVFQRIIYSNKALLDVCMDVGTCCRQTPGPDHNNNLHIFLRLISQTRVNWLDQWQQHHLIL